jgi:two-component system nitrate/nitrite response regulator NarL
MDGIRVALRSSNRLLREAIATSLAARTDMAVIGTTERLSDLVWLCRVRRTDVVLIDVGARFAEEEAAVVGELREAGRDLAIVLTYTWLSAESVDAASRAGATHLVPHSRGIHAIIDAVRRVPRTPDPPHRAPGPSLLTERDRQVLSLMSVGYSVKEMGDLIGVSAATVENHKRRIFAKLGAHSQTQAVARAARMGLLWSPPRDRTAAPPTGSTRVVLVIGGDGELLDLVIRTLLRHGIPTLALGTDVPTTEDELLRFRDLVTAVIVDGSGGDWRAVWTLGIRTVVVIPRYEELTIAEELLRGADAVVPASEVADQLAHVVALASQGYATPDAARAVARSMAGRSPSVRCELTPRELDILSSIALGHSVRQTASALGIARKTVENTQARLFRKLSVRNRVEALAVSYALGLIMDQ